MTNSAPLTKVALIGANGHLGPHILSALRSHPQFKVTVLTRKSSKSTYSTSSNLSVAKLPDDLPHDSLVDALSGHDALVISVAGSETALSKRLVDAAVDAGIRRVIPADFGSCDSSDPHSLSVVPLYPQKKDLRDYVIQKASTTITSDHRLTWTSIVCGHFLDFGLQTTLLGFDVPNRKVRIFDGGNIPFSASMLRAIGVAVVGVLTHPNETADQIVYMHSVSVTQNELLRVVERVVGTNQKFEIEEAKSEEFIADRKERLKQKDVYDEHEISEELVGVEGTVNADWRHKKTFMNSLLGLPDQEDLETVVRESLGM